MESIQLQEPSPVCTFIVYSRNGSSILPRSNTVRVLDQAPTTQNEPGSSFYGHNLTPSPRSVAFEDAIGGLGKTSSSSTFGGSPGLEHAQTSTPDSLHLHSSPQRSPLSQHFAPPSLTSVPMVVCFSDSSNDGPLLLTPIDFLSAATRPEVTSHLATSDTRASLFTISAYTRMDNMETPMINSEQVFQELDTQPTGPTKRVSFMDAGSPLPVPDQHLIIVPSSSTFTLRRAHRPAPLVLEPNETDLSHILVPSNVSQTAGSSTTHSNSSQSSVRQEIPVQKSVERSIQRYHQTSELPSLPVVEFVKRVCIELRIDQEEHRIIRPLFTFKRHIAKQTARPRNANSRPPTASKGHEAFWDNVTAAGLVDFRMSAREVGTFHCGKIARDAILRRVVVNGDDCKDHLTVNVILPLKENGVYTVHGIERERKKVNPKSLVWKFEYTIEDKHLSHKGQLSAGEKLLRPISFICSPELLLPSQASEVTVMHLLSKKLKSSPTAKRIPPPAMPITLPLSASSATSAFSFNPEPNSSASRRRMSRIGTAVKALSRPTTPATDHRLRDELDVGFSFSRRNSVMQHNRNEPKEGKLSSSRGSPHAPRSLSGSHRPNSYKHVLVSNSPLFPASESSPSSFLGERQKAVKKHFGRSVDSLPLPSIVHHTQHVSEPADFRPHTAGFALSKSLKHMSGALAGKMATLNRPATAGARSNEFKSAISRPENSSFRINFRLSRFEAGRQQALPYVHDDGRSSQPHPPWRMPTDEEIDRMLEKAQGFVAAHQQRLEILNRSRGDSKDVSTERFDSSHDNTLQSENLPAPPPPLQSRHHFTGRPIASPRTLERWGKPENGKRRPSTASGTPSEGFMNAPLAGRLSSRTISKRPHTSDGPHQDSTWLPSYPQSQNASTSSLGLPHPPRKQRPSAGKAG